MRWLVIAGILGLSGCVMPSAAEPVFTQANLMPAPGAPNCRDYAATATIDGTPQQLHGRACLQSDGTWRVEEGPAGSPATVIAYYPAYAWRPDYDPWLWGPPIGLTLGGGAVFVDRGNHLHHLDRDRFTHMHPAGEHEGRRRG